jgi:hypothetical protein
MYPQVVRLLEKDGLEDKFLHRRVRDPEYFGEESLARGINSGHTEMHFQASRPIPKTLVNGEPSTLAWHDLDFA